MPDSKSTGGDTVGDYGRDGGSACGGDGANKPGGGEGVFRQEITCAPPHAGFLFGFG